MVQGLGFSFDVEETALDRVVFINKGSVCPVVQNLTKLLANVTSEFLS